LCQITSHHKKIKSPSHPIRQPTPSMPVQSPAIWLIPFVQLKTAARAAWRTRFGDAVMPQIMTLREWASNLGVLAKRSDDVHFDPAIDRITAQRLMHSVAKSTGNSTDPEYVQRLLDAAYELASCASSLAPSARAAWIRQHTALFYTPVFQYEAVIKFLALSWAGGSRFETDVLWQRRAQLLDSAEHIYVTEGLQLDALQAALLAGYEHKTTLIELGKLDGAEASTSRSRSRSTSPTEIVVRGIEDVVQQTVALVVAAQAAMPKVESRALRAHQSIALVALDRQITRRVSAALHGRGIAVRDETGWALSTTTAAAQLLAWLTALTRDAHSDEVLAALKAEPQVLPAAQVQSLEVLIRANGWATFPAQQVPQIQAWQAQWAAPRSVVAWLNETRALLEATQLLTAFEQDDAGQAVLAALHIASEKALQQLSVIDGAQSKMPLPAFIQWVRAVLEASRFKPTTTSNSTGQGDEAQVASDVTVTILPLPQLWGRTFDAVILPGCDEGRLPARPDLAGDWRASEREALKLLTTQAALAAHQKAWDWVCAQPNVTMLRHTNEGSEALSQSVLLQRLQLAGGLIKKDAVIPKPNLGIPAHAGIHGGLDTKLDVFTEGVVINWQHLAPKKLSASSYADLRACPYRFYATRILGLSASDELDGVVDKRDFGTWLHGTLHRFHQTLKHRPDTDVSDFESLLDAAAAAEEAALGLDAAAFLPFSLIWPETRSAYLAWLAQHTAQGYHFSQGEIWKSFALELAGQSIELVGKIDRIDNFDQSKGGGLLLMDYKTESASKTKQRISQADEDTQLAFYAALIHNDADQGDERMADLPVQAAYVNLAERLRDVKTNKDGFSEQTKFLPDIEARRDALLDGIWEDLSGIADGHGLRALGEGAACTHCAARGLCRRDFQ
jgi:ATP-dependent helicase/nuclease subunit B